MNKTVITTSRPRTLPCKDPYLRRLKPPAFVAMLPPIWQLQCEKGKKGEKSTVKTSHKNTENCFFSNDC